MLCPALWLGRKLLPYADGDDVQCACGGYFSEWELVGGLYFFLLTALSATSVLYGVG